VTRLTEAEPALERGSNDEPLGWRLTDVGERVGFLNGQRLAGELVEHFFTRNRASLGWERAQLARPHRPQ